VEQARRRQPEGQEEDEDGRERCKTAKTVVPVAICNGFYSDLWNAGGTCIANHVHKDSTPQCPAKTTGSTVKRILAKCVKGIPTNKAHNDRCKSYGTALAEYY